MRRGLLAACGLLAAVSAQSLTSASFAGPPVAGTPAGVARLPSAARPTGLGVMGAAISASQQAIPAGGTPAGAAINAMIASHGTGQVYVFGAGLYLIDQSIHLRAGLRLHGIGNRTVFKAASGLTGPMFVNAGGGTGDAGIALSDFAIDGSRADQAVNAEVDGIKCYRCGGFSLRHVWLHDIEGHAIHLNNGSATVRGQVIDGVRCDNVGTYPTNTYGSCIAVTHGTGVRISHIRAYGGAKAGLRLSGTGYVISDIACKGNGNGCLTPVSAHFTDSTVTDLVSTNDNGPYIEDGVRLVGAARITLTRIDVSGAGNCGLSALNGSAHIAVSNSVFRDNGQTPGDQNSTTTLTLTGIRAPIGGFSAGDTIAQGGATARIAPISAVAFALHAIVPATARWGTGFVSDTTSGATATVSLVTVTPIMLYLTEVRGTISVGDRIAQGRASGRLAVRRATVPAAIILRLTGVTGQFAAGRVSDTTSGATGMIAVPSGHQVPNIVQTLSESRGGACLYDNARGTTYVRFVGDRFTDDQTPPTQPYGLRLDNHSDMVQIDGDLFGGNALGALDVTTTGTTISLSSDNTIDGPIHRTARRRPLGRDGGIVSHPRPACRGSRGPRG